MSATEQELKESAAEGARKELQLRESREKGAAEMGHIIEERKKIYRILGDLDKRQQELIGYGDCGQIHGLEAEMNQSNMKPKRPY